MAGKLYFAVNEIRHGEADGTLTVFKPGEQVTGLNKETMIQLWEAGVLSEVDPSARPEDDRDAKIRELEAQLAAVKAEAAAAAATATTPAPEGPATSPETEGTGEGTPEDVVVP